jgi:hypothetical protein
MSHLRIAGGSISPHGNGPPGSGPAERFAGRDQRLFRVYADNFRRLALAEDDLYVEQIEHPSRSAGTSEPELMRRGARVGRNMAPLVLHGSGGR